MKNQIIQSTKIIVLAIFLSVGVNFALGAYSEPSSSAPNGNTDAPLNTGSSAQIKNGDFTIGGVGSLFGNYNNTGVLRIGSPTYISGSTTILGTTKIGLQAISASNDLLVNGNTAIKNHLSVGRSVNNVSYGYNLDLTGTTNIGLGNNCTLTSNDINTGCPNGTYLYQLNPASSSSYGKCRYFDPSPNPVSVGSCYSQPALTVAMNQTSYVGGIASPYCGEQTIEWTASASGGIGSHTYVWYDVLDNSNSTPSNWGSVASSGSTFSHFLAGGTGQSGQLNHYHVKVVSTDSTGATASDTDLVNVLTAPSNCTH